MTYISNLNVQALIVNKHKLYANKQHNVLTMQFFGNKPSNHK